MCDINIASASVVVDVSQKFHVCGLAPRVTMEKGYY